MSSKYIQIPRSLFDIINSANKLYAVILASCTSGHGTTCISHQIQTGTCNKSESVAQAFPISYSANVAQNREHHLVFANVHICHARFLGKGHCPIDFFRARTGYVCYCCDSPEMAVADAASVRTVAVQLRSLSADEENQPIIARDEG